MGEAKRRDNEIVKIKEQRTPLVGSADGRGKRNTVIGGAVGKTIGSN